MRLESSQERLPSILSTGICRKCRCRSLSALFASQTSHHAQELIPILNGHADIADDYIGLVPGERLHGLGDGTCRNDGGAAAAEYASNQIPNIQFVIDDENFDTVERYMIKRPLRILPSVKETFWRRLACGPQGKRDSKR
jgi:hypothetical protein